MHSDETNKVGILRTWHVGLWGTAAVIGLAVGTCFAVLHLELPILYRVACGLFYICCALVCVVPVCLAIWSWMRNPIKSLPTLREFIGFVLMEAMGLFVLYVVYSSGNLTLIGVVVLAAAGFLILLVCLAWLVRQRIRGRLRQRRIQGNQLRSGLRSPDHPSPKGARDGSSRSHAGNAAM
jgi:MFS family permease